MELFGGPTGAFKGRRPADAPRLIAHLRQGRGARRIMIITATSRAASRQHSPALPTLRAQASPSFIPRPGQPRQNTADIHAGGRQHVAVCGIHPATATPRRRQTHLADKACQTPGLLAPVLSAPAPSVSAVWYAGHLPHLMRSCTRRRYQAGWHEVLCATGNFGDILAISTPAHGVCPSPSSSWRATEQR